MVDTLTTDSLDGATLTNPTSLRHRFKMADRKAELERKKAKLEQLRAEKKRAEEEKKKGALAPAGSHGIPGSSSAKDLRLEADDILKELGLVAPEVSDQSVRRDASSEDLSDSAATPGGSAVMEMPVRGRRAVASLGISKVTQTNIPPRELVQYSKETQTAGLPENLSRALLQDDVDELTEVATPAESREAQLAPAEQPAVPVEKPPPRILTEEEYKQVLATDEFMRFFDRASRVVERAIAEDIDIFTDYMGEAGQTTPDAGEHLRITRHFADERWSRHRTVTSLDWSPEFPELLVAGYDGNPEAPHDPDGIAMVWNLKFKKTSPEYVFHCQSPVMATCFTPFHPNLVIGGTYSGQVVLWDTRSSRRTPAQRTPLSATGHTHPVYCVNVIGTANAHSLATISTDGRMCFWSLDMLAAPQDSLELQYRQSKSVAATCFSFLAGDSNNFVVGSEDCAVYAGARHGTRAGASGDIFEAHCGPVTGVDCHSVPGPVDLTSYFLSSSIDWTVKLWNQRDSRPILSLEDNSDYVYDVRWSPVHPAVFASVDGTGRIDVWNLNGDTEVPAASTTIDNAVAVNKCRWNAAGNVIAAGDASGRVHVCEVDSTLATPRADEWSRLVHTISEVMADRADAEDTDRLGSVPAIGSLAAAVGQSPLR